MTFSLSDVPYAWIGAALGGAVVWKVIYELYLSPLGRQKIPSPSTTCSRYAKCSSASRAEIRDVEIVKEIYRTHKYRKSSWYAGLTFGGIQNSFSTS